MGSNIDKGTIIINVIKERSEKQKEGAIGILRACNQSRAVDGSFLGQAFSIQTVTGIGCATYSWTDHIIWGEKMIFLRMVLTFFSSSFG